MIRPFRRFIYHTRRAALLSALRLALLHVGRLTAPYVPVRVFRFLFGLYTKLHPSLSDANPLKLRWVDPSEIEYVYEGPVPRYSSIISDDSSSILTSVHDDIIFTSVDQRVNDDAEWPETPLYEEFDGALSNSGDHLISLDYDCREHYLSMLDELIDDLESGYKSQVKLLRECPATVREKNNDTLHPALNEINVVVLSEGQLARRGAGHHRLAVARALGIDEVPVVVRARHDEWQRVRERIKSVSSAEGVPDGLEEYIDHPDLVDVIPSSLEPTRFSVPEAR